MEKNRFILKILKTDTEISYELSHTQRNFNRFQHTNYVLYHFTMKWEILTKGKLSQIP